MDRPIAEEREMRAKEPILMWRKYHGSAFFHAKEPTMLWRKYHGSAFFHAYVAHKLQWQHQIAFCGRETRTGNDAYSSLMRASAGEAAPFIETKNPGVKICKKCQKLAEKERVQTVSVGPEIQDKILSFTAPNNQAFTIDSLMRHVRGIANTKLLSANLQITIKFENKTKADKKRAANHNANDAASTFVHFCLALGLVAEYASIGKDGTFVRVGMINHEQ